MPRNLLIAVVVILLLIVGVWFLTRSNTQTDSASQSTATDEAQQAGMIKVSVTAGGFSPKDITIKAGQSVTWENMDSANHTVNSAPHPTHTLYPFLNVGSLKSGESKTVMFEKAGKYTYHDHLNPSLTGTVTVE